ncbi:MAG: ECF RNA polymerase sigma factor SigK [Sciscionella sp.]
MSDRVRSVRRLGDDEVGPPSAEELLQRVTRGDQAAFGQLYDRLAAPVFGVITRVIRNPAQSEEVTQEVMVEVWRKSNQYAATRGSVQSWVLTMAHRRAVDRVRSEQSASDREVRAGRLSADRPFDEVAENTVAKLERERVRHCLSALTELQRESVTLAYYSGYTYREVAELLHSPLGTVKTRLRDGLIRLRDCLGVAR